MVQGKKEIISFGNIFYIDEGGMEDIFVNAMR